MGDVVGKLLTPLAAVFGPMPNDDPAVLQAYQRSLEGFSDEVLERAATEIIGTFLPSKVRPWPAPAICRKACERGGPAPRQVGAGGFAATLKALDEAAVKFAQRWVDQTEQGRAAHAEGWAHEAKGLVRQIYTMRSASSPLAPADVVLDAGTVAEYRRNYANRRRA